jgi:putative nucleotidyltransferase with HDIG domain
MADYAMLANIRDHSFMVARIAELLSRHLTRAGLPIAVELAVAGALLHDIAKTPCLASGCSHAAMGREICLEHGFAEIADIVGEHVVLHDFEPPHLTAKEVVYYADKRVNHHRIVPLSERLAYIVGRYGQDDPVRIAMIEANFEKCRRIEERLFSFLDFSPDQVPLLLKASGELEYEYAEVG